MDISVVELSVGEAQRVVSAYVYAFDGNYVQWLERGRDCLSAEACDVAWEALEVELRDNHSDMLRQFAADCGVVGCGSPSLDKAVARVSAMVAASPLAALAVVTYLEDSSLTFVPVLAVAAGKCGCPRLSQYLALHEDVDKGPAEAFKEVLRLESALHPDGESVVLRANELCQLLLEEIFHVVRMPMI